MNTDKKIIFILLLSLSTCLSYPKNKIIYLIAPPRSLSSVFLRMMYGRSDCTVFHEPCQGIFYSKNDRLVSSDYNSCSDQSYQ